MELNLKKYLKKIGVNEYEINHLLTIAPLLEFTTFEEAYANILALVKAGFPECDVANIIMLNPYFLSLNYKDLTAKIRKLIQSTDDFEMLIKNNPFII